MTERWPDVPLGFVLRRRKEQILVQDETEYQRLKIRMNGAGVEMRDSLLGSSIGTKKQFVVRSGQFLLSKIDARNGAFGVVPEGCDLGVITGNFWTFNVVPERLDVGYLAFLVKTDVFVEFCRRASEGTTNRLYLQEDAFLRQTIPLPPLPEQRRIAARLEQVSAKLHELSELNGEVTGALQQLPVLVAHRPDLSRTEKEAQGWVERPLTDLMRESRSFQAVDQLENYPNLGIYSFGRGLFEKPPIEGARTSARELNRVKAGQFSL
jgi:type I restriction enzyme S subunit